MNFEVMHKYLQETIDSNAINAAPVLANMFLEEEIKVYVLEFMIDMNITPKIKLVVEIY